MNSINLDVIQVAGSEAVQRLQSLRSAYKSSGEYPFLIGPQEELERLKEHREFVGDQFEKIVNSVEPSSCERFIAERQSEAAEYDFNEDDLLGEWEGELPEKGEIGIHKDILSGRLHKHVYLGLASTTAPWQVPAVVNYGGWNECPDAVVQCTAMKRGGELYGAEIASMSGDVIECLVARPPRTQAAALQLAWEQYWYCSDIVDQGTETISRLAATLINSPYWFFWWD